MTRDELIAMAVLTLKTPALAAHQLMSQQVPRQFLWLALALMGVLNALVYAAAVVIRPPVPTQVMFLPSPFVYLVIVSAGLFALVWAIYLVGRWMGGTGSLDDVLVLVTWMQALRVAAQAGMMVVMLLSSILSLMASFAVFVLGIWIGLHFVNEGHRLGSMGRAAGVLVGAGMVTLMGVSLLLSLVALPFIGGVGDV